MSEHLIQRTLSDRLAETIFEPLPEIARRARIWGLQVEEGDGQLTLRPWGGPVCGLSEGTDPINRAVILGMALIGPLWPYAFPSLLDTVQRLWKQRRKES